LPESLEYIGINAFAFNQFTNFENHSPRFKTATDGQNDDFKCLVFDDEPDIFNVQKNYLKDDNHIVGNLVVGKLNLSNEITKIGNYVFYLSNNIVCTSLSIPNGVTSIGDNAFYYCTGLSGELTISNTCTFIGAGAFASCSNLTGSLTIPNSVVTINSSQDTLGAFCFCSGLNGTLTIGSGVQNIGRQAFQGTNFINFSINTNVLTTIDANAFYECFNITSSLLISSSVTTIGANAFYKIGCPNIYLKSV
jgi:hypothetical protein